jgi:hypothetical protein
MGLERVNICYEGPEIGEEIHPIRPASSLECVSAIPLTELRYPVQIPVVNVSEIMHVTDIISTHHVSKFILVWTE